jgi:hypothetical protein
MTIGHALQDILKVGIGLASVELGRDSERYAVSGATPNRIASATA